MFNIDKVMLVTLFTEQLDGFVSTDQGIWECVYACMQCTFLHTECLQVLVDWATNFEQRLSFLTLWRVDDHFMSQMVTQYSIEVKLHKLCTHHYVNLCYAEVTVSHVVNRSWK